MGEAKRRRSALKKVSYRKTPTILAFSYDPSDTRSLGSVAIAAEAIYVPRSVSVFHPNLPTTNPPAIRPPYLNELRSRSGRMDRGAMVVLDQATLAIADIIPASRFREEYQRLTWTEGFYCRKGGESVLVERDPDNQLSVDGKPIDGVVDFLRGRVREVDGTRMAADQAIAMQAVQLMISMLISRSDSRLTAHFAHIHTAAQAINTIIANSSVGACADLAFWRAMIAGLDNHGERPIPEGVMPPLFPVVAYDWVSRTAQTIPNTAAARGYARAVKDSMSIFRSRKDDDPAVWKDYAENLEVLGQQTGETYAIGKDAARTTLDLLRPESAPTLLLAEQFFAEGETRARVIASDRHSVELIDIGVSRYLVTTLAGDGKEIACWTTAANN